jgi:hypothetical protein
LGTLSLQTGRLDAAQSWLRKAADGAVEVGDVLINAKSLEVLAQVTQRAHRLPEARALAEQALTLERNLDPNVTEIWKTQMVLVRIIEEQAANAAGEDRETLLTEVRALRREIREASRNAGRTRHEIGRMAPIIVATVAATRNQIDHKVFELHLQRMQESGWTQLVAAIRVLLAGERDVEVLCANLDPQDSAIVETILGGLSDPGTIAHLLPSASAQEAIPDRSDPDADV